MKLGTAVEPHAVDTVVEPPTVRTPVTKAAGALINIAASQRRQPPVGIFRALGDDVDNPVDGVRSPDSAARSPDHLNAFNILERSGLSLPIDSGEQRRVDAATVDQDEQFAG